jgi:hypothetical protein
MPAAAPSARAPQYSSTTPKPDNKRKYALFAGTGAAVVVVAVIVFLVLNSSNGGTGGGQNAQSPNNPTSTSGSAPKTKTSDSSDSNVSADLGRTPTSGKIEFSPAGQRVIAFYDFPSGAASSWSMLTPAAQKVYGSQDAFNSYWGNFKSVSAKGARGAYNDDGSVTITATVVFPDHEESRSFRIVNTGSQLLIDAQTKAQADSGPSSGN